MSELKPCPFCGGEAELMKIYPPPSCEIVYGFLYVECKECKSRVDTTKVKNVEDRLEEEQKSIQSWNQRSCQARCLEELNVKPKFIGFDLPPLEMPSKVDFLEVRLLTRIVALEKAVAVLYSARKMPTLAVAVDPSERRYGEFKEIKNES